MAVTAEYEIGRIKTIIGMALDFTAMLRVFEKGSGELIEGMLERFLERLQGVESPTQFDVLHDEFCRDFTTTIRLSKTKEGQSPDASYGHAAKVLDVALKACVDYCQLPDAATSQRVRAFLHAGIDTPILEYLKKEERLQINAWSVREIDRQSYRLLQAAVARQIESEFGGSILPVMWDDIMWRRLNRRDTATVSSEA